MGGPSLLSALNHCQTASGSRLLRSNILEPWTNWQAIHQRLEAVEELASRPTDLHQPIKVRYCVVHALSSPPPALLPHQPESKQLGYTGR